MASSQTNLAKASAAFERITIKKAQTMSSDKSGSPPCGIYVRIDEFDDMQKIITNFRQMAMVINRSSGYEKNMNIVELAYSPDNIQKITDLVILAQNEGLVAIISGELNDLDIMGADGVLLDNAGAFNDTRAKLGDDLIIGLACCKSKEVADKALDLGVDYITLNADPDLISWWSDKSDIFCVASSNKITNKNCAGLARAGASFVDATNYIKSHEKGTMQGAVNILHELECAAQIPDKLN